MRGPGGAATRWLGSEKMNWKRQGGRVVAAAGTAMLFGQACAFDAFNNFGAGDTYDTTTGWNAYGGSTATPGRSACQFNSATSGQLAVIRIACSWIDGFNQVDVRLYNDSGSNTLGTIQAAFTLGGLQGFGGSDPPRSIFNSDPSVLLTMGNNYWIEVAPGGADTRAVWNWNSTGDFGGRRAFSSNNGLSYSYIDGSRRGAMRIETITVPEPATLLGFVVGIALLKGRRRLIK